jgi:hypothetical protein
MLSWFRTCIALFESGSEGAQGAWYTVGYEMAALVELEYGRAAFLEWSEEFLARVTALR